MKKHCLVVIVALSLLLSACSLRGDDAGQPSDSQGQDMEATDIYDISWKEIAGTGNDLTSFFTTENGIFGLGASNDGSRHLYAAVKEDIWQGKSAYLNVKMLELDTAADRRQLIVFAGMGDVFYTVEEQIGDALVYYLCRYDADGNRQQENDITEVWGTEVSILFAAAADSEGRVYLSRGREDGSGNSVLVLDSEGTLLTDIRAEGVVVTRLAAMDNRAYCVIQREWTDVLCRANAENGLLQEEITLTEGRGDVKMMSAGTGSLWISDYEGVKEYQPETGELRAFFSWVDIGISGNDVEAILAQDESHIGAIVVREGKQYYLVMREKGSDDQA